jgi:hypothetical protein
MVHYTSKQHAFLYDTYVKYRSARKCLQKFHVERVPSRQTTHNMMNKLRTTGLLVEKKQKHKRRVLTEEKLDDIGARPEHTPRKSMKCLAQETGVSKSSARRATQLLNSSNPHPPCSHAIQLEGFIFAVGFYSLSLKVRPICNHHAFLIKHGCTCKDM